MHSGGLTQVSAQPVDHPGVLTHEIPAVLDQQLDLPGGTVQLSNQQPVVTAKAINATASASIGSDLPGWRPCVRAAAISPVGTRIWSMPGREQIAL